MTTYTAASTRAGVPRDRPSLIPEMIARVSRDSLFYAISTMAVFPISLLNTAILTRFLNTTEYGRLAILFFFASMVTTFLDLFIMRGVQRRVWATREDEIDLDNERPIEAGRRPLVLGTGMVAELITCVAGTGLIYLFATDISRWILGTPNDRVAIIWAGASGAAGAAWRLVSQIPRWERRRVSFFVVYVSRPLVAVMLAWPFLLLGLGINGVLAATAIATVISYAMGLINSRHSYQVRFEWRAMREIFNAALPMVAIVIGLSLLHDADTFILSQVHSQAQVGLFRVASRITSAVSYAISAFLLAWAPLELSSLFRAGYERYGKRALKSNYTTYYLIVGVYMILGFTVIAKPTLAIIAPSYGAAAPLIPATGVGFLSYGLLIIIARTSEFPHRYLWYGVATVAGAAVMIVSGIALGQPWGAWGVVAGDVLGALTGIAIVTVATLAGHDRAAVDLPRVFAVLLIGTGCVVLAMPVANKLGSWGWAVKVATLALFPALLLLTHTIGKRERRALLAAVRLARGSRRTRAGLIRATTSLPLAPQRLIVAATRDKYSGPRLAAVAGMPEMVVKAELVHALRLLSNAGKSGRFDAGIGELLLSKESVTEKDSLARSLMEAGVRATELHSITSAFERLRSASPRAWTSALLDSDGRLPPDPWPLDRSALRVLEVIIREGQPRALAVGPEGIAGAQLDHCLIGALRALARIDGDPRTDRLIAAFLFDGDARPDAEQLWAAGIDPVEVHELDVRAAAIRRMPQERWAAVLHAVDGAPGH